MSRRRQVSPVSPVLTTPPFCSRFKIRDRSRRFGLNASRSDSLRIGAPPVAPPEAQLDKATPRSPDAIDSPSFAIRSNRVGIRAFLRLPRRFDGGANPVDRVLAVPRRVRRSRRDDGAIFFRVLVVADVALEREFQRRRAPTPFPSPRPTLKPPRTPTRRSFAARRIFAKNRRFGSPTKTALGAFRSPIGRSKK